MWLCACAGQWCGCCGTWQRRCYGHAAAAVQACCWGRLGLHAAWQCSCWGRDMMHVMPPGSSHHPDTPKSFRPWTQDLWSSELVPAGQIIRPGAYSYAELSSAKLGSHCPTASPATPPMLPVLQTANLVRLAASKRASPEVGAAHITFGPVPPLPTQPKLQVAHLVHSAVSKCKAPCKPCAWRRSFVSNPLSTPLKLPKLRPAHLVHSAMLRGDSLCK